MNEWMNESFYFLLSTVYFCNEKQLANYHSGESELMKSITFYNKMYTVQPMLSHHVKGFIVGNIFILLSAWVDLWRCLWDQDLIFLVDSYSWRGSTKYLGLLTRSIYSTKEIRLIQNYFPESTFHVFRLLTQ